MSHKCAAAMATAALLSACTVPRDMHVTYSSTPQHIDDDVRFRTTYYFRTFDYCWDAADAALTVDLPQRAELLEKVKGLFPRATDQQLFSLASAFAEKKKITAIDYARIIPETDTLYRYRMTGKASSVFNQIHFESGSLDKSQIDPFGTSVSYSNEGKGFVVRSSDEVKQDALNATQLARDAETRKVTLEEIKTITALLGTTTPQERASLLASLTKTIDAYAATLIAAKPSKAIEDRLTEIQALAQKLLDQANADSAATPEHQSVAQATAAAAASVKKQLSEAYAQGFNTGAASQAVKPAPKSDPPKTDGGTAPASAPDTAKPDAADSEVTHKQDAPSAPSQMAGASAPAQEGKPLTISATSQAAANAVKLSTEVQTKIDAAAEAGRKDKATISADELKKATATIMTQLSVVNAAITRAGDFEQSCQVRDQIKKGFQVMGPEGLRTFDQNERLLLAMSSSAKPLIATLQEYSGRVLQARSSAAEQQLPLLQANVRVQAARRAVADAQLAKSGAGAVFQAALDQLGAK